MYRIIKSQHISKVVKSSFCKDLDDSSSFWSGGPRSMAIFWVLVRRRVLVLTWAPLLASVTGSKIVNSLLHLFKLVSASFKILANVVPPLAFDLIGLTSIPRSGLPEMLPRLGDI